MLKFLRELRTQLPLPPLQGYRTWECEQNLFFRFCCYNLKIFNFWAHLLLKVSCYFYSYLKVCMICILTQHAVLSKCSKTLLQKYMSGAIKYSSVENHGNWNIFNCIHEAQGVLHGLYSYVCPQRMWFSVVLVINRVWFLPSGLELSMSLRSYFSMIRSCLGQLCKLQWS